MYNFDLFGQSIRFTQNNKSTYRSNFGGIMSVLLILAMGFLFISGFISFI